MSPSIENRDAMEWMRRQVRKVETRDTLTDKERAVAATVEVEAWLQREKVAYAPTTAIPMNMIDEKRSRNNQARRDPLVEDSVARYTVAMKAGAPFPPIVLYPVGNRLVIVDGNNRHAAAKKAGCQAISGIVISETTPSDVIQLLTVQANSRHGKTEPVEWRVRQAIGLMAVGHSMEKAADASGVSVIQLRNAKAAAEADIRARQLKIFGFPDLPSTSKQYLNSLKDEPIFRAASILAVGKKMNIEQVMSLCREVRKGRSEADRLEIIDTVAQGFDNDLIAKKAQKKGFGAPPQRVFTGAGIFMACDPAELVSSIRTVHDRDEVNRRLEEAVTRIFEIQEAMEALKSMEREA